MFRAGVGAEAAIVVQFVIDVRVPIPPQRAISIQDVDDAPGEAPGTSCRADEPRPRCVSALAFHVLKLTGKEIRPSLPVSEGLDLDGCPPIGVEP
jgi:hypothetical protein